MSRTRAPSAVRAVALAVALFSAGARLAGARPSGRAAADKLPTPDGQLALYGIEDVDSGDSERERVGIRKLVHAGEAGFSVTERCFRLESTLRRKLALVSALACFDSAQAEDTLVTQLDDPHFEVRALIAQALGGGKSKAGVASLVTLARDLTPSVRAAALRALFAIDRADAVAARASMTPDAAPELRTRRLGLHRLRGDQGPEVLRLAIGAYLAGVSAAERTAGARLLVAQGAAASPDLRRLVIAQFGGVPAATYVARTLLRAPPTDPDPAESRLAAAEALLAHVGLGRIPDVERDGALRLAVSWIARPARVRNRQVDDEARGLLLAALPDLTTDPAVRAMLVAEVTARLRHAAFDDPAHGIRLLLAFGEASALPALVSLVDPEGVPRAVLGHVSGALRDLRRTGDLETARRLVSHDRPSEIRTDGTRALAGEAWSLAGPLLSMLLDDDNDAVASEAATVLLVRREPEARARLEAALLDRRWRPYEQNAVHALIGPVDDQAYALLERLLREGGTEARRAVFIEISTPMSSLRGARAAAIVRLAIDNPSYEIDVGTIATALASVDGLAAVHYIREYWTRVTRPGVLLRNLQVVAEREALEYALEIAGEVKDDDEHMLAEVAAVVSGRSATAPDRTDPFWKRLLSRGSLEMRRVAVRALASVDHGPMSAYLVPYLADKNELASSRRDALLALERGKEPLPENLLWTLASDRLEDEDLRTECARALVAIASDPIREKAVDWLAQCVEEANTALFRIAELAGTRATPDRALRLLALFQGALSKQFATPPYLRPPDDDDTARSIRVQALTIAAATTNDQRVLEALADTLVDPRFAVFQREARRAFAFDHGGGGGPLTSGVDPLELDVALRLDGATPNETPRPPLPPEAGDLIEALVKGDPVNGVHRIEQRLARARTDGSLAKFDDLFVAWASRRISSAAGLDEATDHAPGASGPLLPGPARPDGPEATFDLDRRSQFEESAGRFDAAATLAEQSLAAGARCGVIDLPPSRWLDRGHVPQPSYRLAKSRVDLLRGAAHATSGRLDQARALFAEATGRERLDPRVFQEAALLRLRAKFEPDAALADVARAAELERRQGEEPSRVTVAVMAAVRRARGGEAGPGPASDGK